MIPRDILKRFNLFTPLPSTVLDYLSNQIEVGHYEEGADLMHGTSAPRVRLLMRGSIQLTGAQGTNLTIKANSKQAQLPIPAHLPEGQSLHAMEKVTTLELSRDLYTGIEKIPSIKTSQQSDIGQELNQSGGVLAEFYVSLKKHELKLPSMPGITTQIAKVVKNPDTVSEDIAKVIQADPTVAGRIMSVVNSPAYRGVNPIQNLPDAVSRLGRQVTHNLVISFALSSLFYSRSEHLKKLMHSTWKHSNHVAAVCHELGRLTPGLSPDQALLCGLVHNIGVLPAIEAARAHPDLLKDPKKLEWIINHFKGGIGAAVLKEWGFTDEFVQVALHAEDWMRDESEKADYVDLVQVAILHASIGTDQMHNLPRLDLIPAFHKLALGKLTPRHSLEILDNAKEEIDEIRQLLSG
jgi:HD-like signal output (HDOD) protein